MGDSVYFSTANESISSHSNGPVIPVSSKEHRYLALALINISFAVGSLLLNSLMLEYYSARKRRRKFIPEMYIIICVVNLTAAALAIVHSAVFCLEYTKSKRLDLMKFLIYVGYIFYVVVSNTSIFGNVSLSVARSINLFRPFYRLKRMPALIFIAVNALFWAIMAITDITLLESSGRHVPDKPITMVTLPEIHQVFICIVAKCQAIEEVAIMVFSVTFVLPLVVMIIASIHQGFYLLCHKRNSMPVNIDNAVNIANQLKMTTTIFLSACLCLICYLTYAVSYAMQAFSSKSIDDKEAFHISRYVYSTVFLFAISFLQPLLFLVRGSSIRKHFNTKIKRVTQISHVTVTLDKVQ